MGPKLKVYGGHLYGSKFGPRGSRVVVAAHSWQEAGRLVKTSYNYLKRFWSVTENVWAVEVALAKPLAVFYVPDSQRYKAKADFKEWTP